MAIVAVDVVLIIRIRLAQAVGNLSVRWRGAGLKIRVFGHARRIGFRVKGLGFKEYSGSVDPPPSNSDYDG